MTANEKHVQCNVHGLIEVTFDNLLHYFKIQLKIQAYSICACVDQFYDLQAPEGFETARQHP